MARSKAGRLVPPPPKKPGAPTTPGGSEPFESPNELIESAYQRGKVGLDQTSLIDRIKQRALRELRDTFVTQPELKGSDAVTTDGKTRTRFFAPVIDAIRTLHSSPRNARAEAQKLTSAIFKNLEPDEYDLTKRYLFLRDAHENVTRGMERRPGFDAVSVTNEINRLQEQVDANPDVQQAVSSYKNLMNSVRDLAKGEGLMHNVDREWYFPHTILDFTDLLGSNRKIMGVTVPRLSAGGIRWKTPRNFLARTGSARDISTNLADQMENYLSDVFTQIEKRKVLNRLGEQYDVRNNPTYKDKLGNAVLHVEAAEQIPPGFIEWDPNKGFARLRASSMAERYLGEMMDYGGLDELAKHLQINPVEFRQALEHVGIDNPEALTRKMGASLLPDVGRKYVIPEEMARTLDKAVDQINKTETLGLSEHLVRGWKSVVLNMAPIRYNFRNLLGDTQRIYAQFGNEALDHKSWARVTRSVHDYYSKGLIDPLYQQMLDYGVSSSGRIQSEYMLSRSDQHLKLLEHGAEEGGFEKFADKAWKALSFLPEKSSAREDVVRGVLMDMNTKRLAEGKPLLTGTADRELVQGLLDRGENQRAIAYIARKSLLDYGDFTPRENQWRNGWFPFYAWASGNFQFWNTLARNVGRGAVEGSSAAPMARASSMAAMKGAAATAVILGTVRLWNEKVMGDWEEKIPENIRSTTHFILPDYDHWSKTGEIQPAFNDEGKVRYWSTRDALDDFMTFLGLDTAVPEAFSVARGTLSKDEYVRRQREYAGWGKGAARTVLSNLGPREQMLSQMVLGKRMFPDPLNPTDIAPDQRAGALRDVLGLSALPGVEGTFGAASPGTDIFQPSTKVYDVPKQLGFGSAREPTIFMHGQLKNPSHEGLTVYEADLVKRIQQKQFELRELEGRMTREYSMQSNRQLDQSTRDSNLAARQAEIQEIVGNLKELANRLTTLQRTRRHAAANR